MNCEAAKTDAPEGGLFEVLDIVVAAIGAQGMHPTASELLDAIWLVAGGLVAGESLPRPTAPPAVIRLPALPVLPPSGMPPPPPPDLPKPDRPVEAPAPDSSWADVLLPAREGTGQTGGIGGLPLLTPGARALPGTPALARALRPLKRRVPSRTRVELDEEQTVRRIAEERTWIPVVRPAPARWLEIALVVDTHPSMLVWQQTLREWQLLLERQAAFRDVRVWQIDTTERGRVVLRAPGNRQGRNPGEMIDPSGRRLLLVATDCLGPAWDGGAAPDQLRRWGERLPLAILHMLPERLWSQTAMDNAEMVGAQANRPAQPNRLLRKRPLPGRLGLGDGQVPLLVTTLEPEFLGPWARLVAGFQNARMPAAIFGEPVSSADGPEEPEEPEAVPTAAERIDRFRNSASATAFRLACLLAASPLRLPIMRLVQQTMQPASRQVHLAEVYLGGLLRRLTPARPGEEPDEIMFEFHEGVRSLLLDRGWIPDQVQVLQVVSDYVQQFLGSKLDIRAVLANPAAPLETGDGDSAFATLSAEVLARLGGPFAEVARCLRGERGGPSPTPPPVSAYLTMDQIARFQAWADENGVDHDLAEVLAVDPNLDTAAQLWTSVGGSAVICERACEMFAAVTASDYVQIWRHHPGRLELVASRIVEGTNDYQLASFGGVIGRAASRGELVYLPDVSGVEDYIAAEPSTRAELAMPIADFDAPAHTWGVVNIEFPYTNPLAQATCQWLALMAFSLHAPLQAETSFEGVAEASLPPEDKSRRRQRAILMTRMAQRLLPLLPLLRPTDCQKDLQTARHRLDMTVLALRQDNLSSRRPGPVNRRSDLPISQLLDYECETPHKREQFAYRTAIAFAREVFGSPESFESRFKAYCQLATRALDCATKLGVASRFGIKRFLDAVADDEARIPTDTAGTRQFFDTVTDDEQTVTPAPLWPKGTAWEPLSDTLPDFPRLWVHVAGTRREEMAASLDAACHRVAENLVAAGCGLVVGTSAGVNTWVARHYLAALSVTRKRPENWLFHVDEPGRDPVVSGGRVFPVPPGTDPRLSLLSRADAVIVLNGEDIEDSVDLRQAPLIFPVAQTGGDARYLYLSQLERWSTSPIQDWSPELFEFLNEEASIAIDVLFRLPPFTPRSGKTPRKKNKSPLQAVGTLRGHHDVILRTCWHPFRRLLATASVDKTIRIWDVYTCQTVTELSGHSQGVNVACWSPDGRLFASASFDRTIRIWSADDWRPLHELHEHTGDVTDLAWSPDGKTLASASDDRTICLLDPQRGKRVRVVRWLGERVHRLAWEASGLTLWAGSKEGTIRSFKTANTRAVQNSFIQHQPGCVTSLAISPDGRTLVSASDHQQISIFPIGDRQSTRVVEAHRGAVRSVSFSAEGKLLASNGDDDSRVKLWRTDDWTCVHSFSEPTSIYWVCGLAWAPHAPMLATFGARDHEVRLWQVDIDELLGGGPPEPGETPSRPPSAKKK